MQPSFSATIIQMYSQTHNRLLALVGKMTDAQLHWQPTAQSHLIAFHMWHLGTIECLYGLKIGSGTATVQIFK